ncbi:MAG: hypothetical protein K0V04_09880 [Deltaproteobacteria bacterium]|nr:hypothetical protein [Deltaproteobacteria bacterium]
MPTLNRAVRRLAVLLAASGGLVCTGCGSYWTSNSVDLAPTADVPVRVRGVTMRHSLIAGLGMGPQNLSSADAPNAMGVDFDIEIVDAVPHHADVAARVTCLVDGHLVRNRVAHNASDRLASAVVGTVVSGSGRLMPSAFQREIPTQCEAELLYTISPPGPHIPEIGSPPPAADARRPAPVSLGVVCLEDGTLHEGRCTPQQLPRTPAPAALVVSAVDASIGARPGGTAFGLTASVMVTAGTDVPREARVFSRARCEVDGETQDLSLPLMVLVNDLAPGESIVGASATPKRFGTATAPARCQLSFMSGVGDTTSLLAEYCVERHRAVAGPCPGLEVTAAGI